MKQLHTNGLEIAVVGIGLRLPGVNSGAAFFDSLCRGDELIRRLDEDALRAHGVPEQEFSRPGYVPAAGYLDGRFDFDADFFGYKPREAEFMDPQLRLLHECCWEALEQACCDPQLAGASVGLYTGAAQNMGWLRAVAQHVGDNVTEIYDLKMLYQREFFNSRVAYRLNLKGPALGVDATCATSLVALHLAAQALLSGDCNVALAGGVCIAPQVKGYQYHEGMIQSPDGHCRAFDADAKGTVPGQGAGIVALKRLDDAIADGNPIYAVLKSSALNNDGDDKVGYTAPSVSGQAAVIRAALELAEVDPDGIDFVECHGTATRIGDPIEVEALAQAYGGAAADGPRCLIGSVKSNVGHLDTAAGIIGFIKAVLALHHGRLPPSLHYRTPNPMIPFANSRFAVNAALAPLAHPGRALRGAVSSFGVGGTNAHAIVEEYVERRQASPDSGRARLFPLSARTPESLRAYAARLAQAVRSEAPGLDGVARTLQQGRRHYRVREALVADSRAALLAQLDELAATGETAARQRKVVFMFSGQGSQYPGMGRELYLHLEAYRSQVDQCLALLDPARAAGLRELLLAEPSEALEARAAATEQAQPLLFIVEYALARTLMGWGVQPAAMLGHSLGEYVAACLAGVFTLADALKLVCERASLMGSARPGAMLSVRLSEQAVGVYLGEALELAAVNSSAMVVVSGEPEQIAALEMRLANDGVACTRLKTSHAYHSRMMEPILERFRACVAATARSAPACDFRSSLTGLAVTAEQAQDPDYWCRQLRHSVRFADATAQLLGDGAHVFVEIGPGNTLTTLVRSHADFGADNLCLQTLRHPREAARDDAFLLRTLARLYADGAEPDWRAVSAGSEGPFLALPTYAFASTRYDQVAGAMAAAARAPQGAPAPAAAISHPRPRLSTPFVAAHSALEQRLCALWCAIFRIDQVGIDDNFFELGGHSLLATRLLADVHEACGVALALATLFEQPHVRGLAVAVEQAGAAPARWPRLEAADRSRALQVSFQQRRLWAIDRLGAGSPQYNMASPFILHGRLDLAALQGALDLVAGRHDSLRTVFTEVDGEPVQIIHPAQPVALRRLDLSDLAEDQRDQSVRALVREDALRAFDLACEMPMRVTLAALAEHSHLLLFNVHHIVSDGWSEMILVREFAEAYQALAAGRAPALAPLTLQYADFAAWQRGWLSGETLERELAFWRARLEGMPPLHDLPLDRPRPAVSRHAGALLRRTLPVALMDQLRSFSQAQGATLFMTLQAAFALLLGRMSNSEDVVMGTPIAGRQHKPLEGLIGFFVNTLLLRTDLGGNPSFIELLARTRTSALAAFEHQHVPFEMLVDALAPGRSRRHPPLFQVLFALQNYERGAFALEGMRLERVEETVSAKVDLNLIMAESEAGLYANWYYDTELFDHDSIARMADRFEVLLQSLLAAPAAPVLELPLLAPAEQAALEAASAAAGVRVLDAAGMLAPFGVTGLLQDGAGLRARWSGAGLELLGGAERCRTLRGYRIELAAVEAALARHPAIGRAVAAVVDDELVAYAETGGTALSLAELGAFLEGSLADTMQPQALVTLAQLPLRADGSVDTAALPAWTAPRQERTLPRNPMEQRVLDAWCAVLQIEAPSIDQDFFSLGADSILLLKLSAHLNRAGLRFSVRDFYAEPTIEAMARLVETVAGDAVADGPAQGEQALHPVQQWFLEGDPTERHHFNQAVLLQVDPAFDTGLAQAALDALYRRHDALRLRFVEAGRWSASYRADAAPPRVERIVIEDADARAALEQAAARIQASLSLDGPLLRVAHFVLPGASARLLIVVHHLVVDGVSWRVLLQDFDSAYRQAAAGAAIALPARPASFQRAVEQLARLAATPAVRAEMDYWRGVLATPTVPLLAGARGADLAGGEASHTVVLPAPLTERLLTTSARAYGMNVEEVLVAALRLAVAEWAGPGALALLMEGHGRAALSRLLDCGETVGWFTALYPLALAACPADPAELLRDTKEAVRGVPAKGEHFGALRYLDQEGRAALDDAHWREGAISFNYLGQFDQTVNSASLFSAASEKAGASISPHRRRDALLALDGMVTGGCLRMSIKYHPDHFSAARIGALGQGFMDAIARLADYWNCHELRRLTPSDVGLLRAGQDELDGWQQRYPGLRDAYPATGSQQGMLFQSLHDAKARSGSFVNQLIFDIEGELDVERLRRAWETLPERHDVFRTAFVACRQGGIAQLALARESVHMPFAVQDLSALEPCAQAERIAQAVAADRELGFDIGQAPLSRLALWRTGARLHRVLWTTHHAIIDGWSVPLVFRSLLDHYTDGRAPAARTFKQYVQWLHEQDTSAAKAYWRQALAPLEAPCLVPGDAPGGHGPAQHLASLDAAALEPLEALARDAGVTLYSLVQCAWAYLLYQYTGQEQVCFGSVNSGRPPQLAGAEGTVGPFINTLPVTLAVDNARPLRAWLRDAQRQHLEYQGHGFLQLPDVLAQSRFGARTALFNSVLVYENYPVDSIRSGAGADAPLAITGLHSQESTGAGLTLVVMPGRGLTVKLMYQGGEFSAGMARAILDQFMRLLGALPTVAQQRTGALEAAADEQGGVAAETAPGAAELSDEELLALLGELEALSDQPI